MKILVLALTAATSVFAEPIVQSLSNGNRQIASNSPFAQSFIADDVNIASIGIFVTAMNPSFPNDDIAFSLFQGAGFGGEVLGTSSATPGDIQDGWVDANFSAVSLVIGQAYTFQIAASENSPHWAASVYANADLDAYTAGTMYTLGQPTIGDLRFRVLPGTAVELPPSPVPEPTTFALFGLGSLALLAMRKRLKA